MPSSFSLIADRAAPIAGFWMPPEIRAFVDRVPRLPSTVRRSFAAYAGRTVVTESDVAGFSGVLPKYDSRRRRLGLQKKRDYIMVASLMCKYRCRPSNCLFSTSLRNLQSRVECRGLVMRLAGADRHCLPVVLDVVVSLMNKHDVPVGWYCLLYDVIRFDNPSRFVQKSWSA